MLINLYCCFEPEVSALVKNASILQKEEKMVEMQNGCICCTLREDLLVEVYELSTKGGFDYLVIESTGISEPLQVITMTVTKIVIILHYKVAETFTFTLDEADHGHDHSHDHDHDHAHAHTHAHDHDHVDGEGGVDEDVPILKDVARLDNCVTVIDACNFFSTFETGDFLCDRFTVDNEDDDRTVSHLMIDQIEFANIIVLNKVDMVKPGDHEKIKKTLKLLNPGAEIYSTNYSRVPLDKVLNTHKFNFEETVRHHLNFQLTL